MRFYSEYLKVEDPFSVLSVLVQDELKLPELYDVHHTLSSPPYSTSTAKRKHWIIHHGSSRRDDEPENASEEPLLRPPAASDYGTYPEVLGAPFVPRLPLPLPPTEDDLFFNSQRAVESEDYLREVVYGGLYGYAYARSLAEFVNTSRTNGRSDGRRTMHTKVPLKMPLSEYVRRTIIQPLTGDLHSIIEAVPPHNISAETTTLGLEVEKALHLMQTLSRPTTKIDVSCLIRDPQELFNSDQIWAGRPDPDDPDRREDWALALDYAADLICGISMSSDIKVEDRVDVGLTNGEEDPRMLDLRMNLLALAKRAPLSVLAPLKEDLVPDYLRHTLMPMLRY